MDDFDLAKLLQDEEFQPALLKSPTKSAFRQNEKNKPTSLVDPEWEVIDPNPDIHSLFQEFDRKYFWKTLGAVEVKWSHRMTSCAGTCTYKGRGGCIVALSLPLLKLRPRKDLIETLLHEMIHAYLFLTNNNQDRDGHGPIFHQHMNRINALAGTKISVYHTFHDEVRHYKTHWWRCDGPCRFRKPFFGIVKRATNRAPGRWDYWFEQHQATCGGTFEKIQEPEGFKSRKKKTKGDDNISSLKGWLLPKKGSSASNDPLTASKKTDLNGFKSNITGFNDFNRLSDVNVRKVNDAKTSNIHGFENTASGFQGSVKSNKGGTVILNPKTYNKTKPAATKSDDVEGKTPFKSFAGSGYKLGGTSGTNDRSNSRLLKTFPSVQSTVSPPLPKKLKTDDSCVLDISKSQLVSCPVCGAEFDSSAMNDHLDSCLNMDFTNTDIDRGNSPPSPSKSLFTVCPVCGRSVYKSKINEHVDACVESYSPGVMENVYPSTSNVNPPSPDKNLFANCPVCNQKVYKNKMDEHLEACARLDFVMDGPSCDIEGEECVSDSNVHCPCCNTVCPAEQINIHLDSCLVDVQFD